jgi:hypothetical protein
MHRIYEKLLNYFLAVTVILSLSAPLALATNNSGIIGPNYWEWRDYIGQGTEREYLPVTVLYDPYGDKSYQKISTTSTITFTFKYKGGGNIYVSGQTSSSLTESIDYSSSLSTDPADMGPGKGDRIIGKVYDLTWDIWKVTRVYPGRTYVWYEYNLVSSSYVGDFQKSRSALAAISDTRIADKTETSGAYRRFWDVSANSPLGHSVGYSWSGEIAVGFEFNLNLYGLQAVLSFSLTFSATQTYTVYAYYLDSANELRFYENADSATPDINNVYSYVFWYGPA